MEREPVAPPLQRAGAADMAPLDTVPWLSSTAVRLEKALMVALESEGHLNRRRRQRARSARSCADSSLVRALESGRL